MRASVCLRACSLNHSAFNAPPYFHLRSLWVCHIFRHYLINGTIFGKKVTEYKMCVLIFSTTFIEKFIILKIIQRDIVINVKSSSLKVPLLLSDFNETWIFSTDFREKKKTQISILTKIRPVGAELLHTDGLTDGRTDMTKLRVAFRNFANAPKKKVNISVYTYGDADVTGRRSERRYFSKTILTPKQSECRQMFIG